MANVRIKFKIKDAIGILAHAEYEGEVIAFAGFYITPQGEVKNIVCCDNTQIMAMVGGASLLQDMIKGTIQIKRD